MSIRICHGIGIGYQKTKVLFFIEKYIDKPWNWRALSYGCDITLDFIIKHSDKWVWEALSINKKITTEIVEMYPEKNWNWKLLSNINLTIEFISKFIEKDWSLTTLISNPCLSTKDKIYICTKI